MAKNETPTVRENRTVRKETIREVIRGYSAILKNADLPPEVAAQIASYNGRLLRQSNDYETKQ